MQKPRDPWVENDLYVPLNNINDDDDDDDDNDDDDDDDDNDNM